VIASFQEGATAEESCTSTPLWKLADVYSVIGYYLRRRQDVEAYLQRRSSVGPKYAENEARYAAGSIRDRLLARRGA